MAEIEVIHRDPLHPQQLYPVWFSVDKTPLARRWVQALKGLLESRHLLEKNFCFIGWPATLRTFGYLTREMNRHIAVVNQFNRTGRWVPPYFIEERCIENEAGPTQEQLNRLHHHFELLMGQVWNVSAYVQNADPETYYSIRQINNLVHEMEQLRRTQDLLQTAADQIDPFILFSTIQEEKARYPLQDEDYHCFGFQQDFGTVHLFYCQTGKPHFDAWKDGDEFVAASNINGLRYLSGEFSVVYRSSGTAETREETLRPFYRWLEANGAVLTADKTHYVDENGVKQGLGFPRVARLAAGQFGGSTQGQIREKLAGYQDIYAVRVHDRGKITEAVYPYHWGEPHHDRRQRGAFQGYF